MKILFVAPRLPWPARDGGQVCMAQHVELLALGHEVRVLAAGAKATGAPQGIGVETISEPRPSPAVSWARSLGSRWPATLHRYRSPRLARRVRDLVATWKPDLAMAENLHLAYLPAAVPEVPWLLVEQNVESLFLARHAAARSGLLRALYGIEARRMRAVEPALLEGADAVLAVDEGETAWIREHAPRASAHFVPVGVSRREEGAHDGGFLLLGSWRWAPNREAAAWFLKDIWPQVRAQRPDARVHVVGPGTGADALGFAADGVVWEGEVPDVAPFFARARALVVPLRSGAGLRVKILEAMAAGTAVVSTRLGVGGLDMTPGAQLLVAESPREWAEAVLRLEDDATVARRIGEAGRAWALERFGMASVAQRLEAAVEDAVARGRARLAR